MAKNTTPRSSIDMAEEVQRTNYVLDPEKAQKVVNEINEEIKEARKRRKKLTYSTENYRFNL